MQEKLIIYLHAHDLASPGWAVVDAQGLVSQSAYQDSPDGLAAIAEGKEVIVWVPSQDVVLTQVTLPKMSRTRLAEALPFALEEQLIADVETLHFAHGEHQPDQALSVMIVAHEKMQAWLSQLRAWNIEPHCLLPDMYGLPVVEGVWHIVINDLALVRTGPSQGFACDKNNLPALLELTASTALPERIAIHNYSGQAHAIQIDMPTLIQEEHISREQFLSDLSRMGQSLPSKNLLQGKYAVKKSRLPQVDKLWKAITYVSCALIALLFLYPLTSYFILKQRVNSIDQEIAQIYKRQFPQAKNVVAPKMRMEEKLQKVSASRGESRLLSLLSYVGKGMMATPNVKLKRFDFQNGLLALELMAASSDDFSAFTSYLSDQGLVVKQKNATLAGERINATLEIES